MFYFFSHLIKMLSKSSNSILSPPWFVHYNYSLLSHLKHCRTTDFDQRVKEFSAKLALVPIPPPGDLHVVGLDNILLSTLLLLFLLLLLKNCVILCLFWQVFNLNPLVIVLPSREDKHHPVVDLDLHLPFLCFQTRELLQV